MAAVVDPFLAAADLFDPPVDPYLADPAGWVKAKTGEHLWSTQIQLMESVRDNRRTAVPACHGPGKSWSASRLAGWFLDVHPVGSAFVVTTAPTDKQVKAILWREIGRAHTKGDLAGEVLQTAEWKIGGELVAYGRKPADHDEEAFQGIHARHVLVILDEASGVPKSLWEASTTLMTNDNARVLAIGNPDNPMSEFERICRGADPVQGGMSDLAWNVLPISVFATPNFSGEAVPDELRMDLTSRGWAEDFARQMGAAALVEAHNALVALFDAGHHLAAALALLPDERRDLLVGTPRYVSKVLGQFPTDAEDGVVPWSWLAPCTTPREPPEARSELVELGVDIGGSDSGDETVIYERVGMRVGRRWSVRSSDPDVVASKIEEAIDTARPRSVKVDSIGIGWGVLGILRRSRPHVHIVGVNVAEAASEKDLYLNLRSQIWFEVGRELSRDGAWDLSSLGEESTLAELTAPTWWENKSGRIVVESKDDIRKRLGRSTDNADALLLAFYHAGEPMQWRSPADMRIPTGRMAR